MRAFCPLLIIFVLSQLCIAAHSSHKEEAIRYLQLFGYLPRDKNITKIDNQQLHHAIKKLQINGHIEVTGRLDDNTLQLIRTPRCGVRDDTRSHKRQKRFALLGSKWNKHHITWSFNHKYGQYYHDSLKVRRVISEALAIWGMHSVLTFEEVLDSKDVDIIVSFESAEHPEVDHYSMNDPILAHAFRPGSGLGGDVHFREDFHWNLDVMFSESPPRGQKSFFAVALHELGHSLGLGHSDDQDAVMFGIIHKYSGVLSQDDINGIHHIYGVPSRFKGIVDTTTESQPEEQPQSFEPKMPEKCDTTYDAIARIRGELFIFKDQHMFRPDSNSDAIEIRALWKDLPEDFKKVDAVFEDDAGKISFFIGRMIYMFDSIDFVGKSSLSSLGLHHHIANIDAIFKWHYNQFTYIFSGDQYWRMKGSKVSRGYPKLIQTYWRDVYDIDTAFSDKNELYFFKGKYFHEFDSKTMRLKRMDRKPSAQNFMNCPGAKATFNFGTRFGDEDLDVIDEDVDEEIPEEHENIEKMAHLEDTDSALMTEVQYFLVFISLLVLNAC